VDPARGIRPVRAVLQNGEFSVTHTTTEGATVITSTYVYGGVDFSHIRQDEVSAATFTAEHPAMAGAAPTIRRCNDVFPAAATKPIAPTKSTVRCPRKLGTFAGPTQSREPHDLGHTTGPTDLQHPAERSSSTPFLQVGRMM